MFGKNGWSWFKKNKMKENETKVEKKISHEQFPCSSDNCLVRAACTKPCDKLVWDTKELKDLFERYLCCPDCGSTEYIEGPQGGGSENIQCAGCKHYFNFGFPLFVERIHCTKDSFNQAGWGMK